MIHFDPHTLREHFAHWLSWRVTSAHRFAIRSMRINKETQGGSQDIFDAPLGWYVPRFVVGWRLGRRYIIRSKREVRRLDKSLKL